MVRRAAIYGGLTVDVTALFVGVYLAVLALLADRFASASYRWLAVGVATVAVLLVEPLRRRLVVRLERRYLS